VDVDLLIGAGALRHLTFSMVTLEAFGLAPNFRRAIESGALDHREVSALALEVAIEAAARNVPFLPFPGLGTSDLIAANPDFYGTVRSTFDDTEVPAVRAVKPDVAIIHALRCDHLGNAQFDGTYGMDPELARAAGRVIVTCEELVDTEEIARTAHMTKVPGFLVDAVVEAPFGAHPCSHVPRYALDGWQMLEYARAASGAGFDEYVETIRGETEAEYRARVLGDGRGAVLARLAATDLPMTEVGV
jgi:acyl CoA:acetate/3-ketoacid CoA transferase alpha subunit